MLPGGEVLSKLLTGLYDAATDPNLWDAFLQQLAPRVGATSAGLIMVDVDQDAFTVSKSWNVDPEAKRQYNERYGSIDIWTQRAILRPAGFVCTSVELCPPAEMARQEYNDFLLRFEASHGMFGLLENTGKSLSSIGFYRSLSCPAFGTAEVKLLSFLVPHAQQAFRLHLQFSALNARQEGIDRALDMFPTGIVLLDARGQIVFMNRKASEIVAQHDGLLATRNGLRAERQEESALIAKTVQAATSTSKADNLAATGTLFVSRRARPPLQVLICPIRDSASSALCAAPSVRVIAFVSDPSQTRRPAPDVLRTLFGLTPAECRVALLLSDGHAPAKIADMVGVTTHTVRSQIKSIFSKTGVKRQSELIRLLLNNSGFGVR
jgi:DNA-binding CsgD family transcriptional regulator/PAS domain-containing protein